MKKFFETTPSILEGIEQRDLPCLLNSLGAHRRSYARGEAVSHVGSRCIIGVLLSGRVQIVQEDLWGNRSVIGTAGTGELFGEAFACAGLSQMPVGVFCIEPAELLLLDGTRLSGLEPSPARQRLNENLLRILAGKAVALIQKNAFVSRRTTREKLLSYLSAQARQAAAPPSQFPSTGSSLPIIWVWKEAPCQLSWGSSAGRGFSNAAEAAFFCAKHPRRCRAAFIEPSLSASDKISPETAT